jgi:hypothetical protein
VGTVLFAALLLGALALAGGWRELRTPLQRAAVAASGVWLLTGYLLFSFAGRAHPRYLEAFTPAVAIVLGVAISSLARRARAPRGVALFGGALLLAAAEAAVATGRGSLVEVGLGAGIGLALVTSAALLLALRDAGRRGGWPVWCGPGLIAGGALAAILAFPLARDARIIRSHSGVQAATPSLSPREVGALSAYLRTHAHGMRYEVAASSPATVAQLIVRDARPILLLTTINARPLTTLPQLRRDAAHGLVRYVLTHGRCPVPPYHVLPACAKAVRWVTTHAADVTAQLGIPGERRGLLYRLKA